MRLSCFFIAYVRSEHIMKIISDMSDSPKCLHTLITGVADLNKNYRLKFNTKTKQYMVISEHPFTSGQLQQPLKRV